VAKRKVVDSTGQLNNIKDYLKRLEALQDACLILGLRTTYEQIHHIRTGIASNISWIREYGHDSTRNKSRK
jgi:hypothetical protein